MLHRSFIAVLLAVGVPSHLASAISINCIAALAEYVAFDFLLRIIFMYRSKSFCSVPFNLLIVHSAFEIRMDHAQSKALIVKQ